MHAAVSRSLNRPLRYCAYSSRCTRCTSHVAFGCARPALTCKRRRAGAPARSLGRAADAPHGRRRHGRGEDGAATRLANAEAFSNQRGIAAGAAEAFRAAVSRSLTTHGYPQWHDIPCDTVSHGGTVHGVVHPLPCRIPQRHGISQRHGIPWDGSDRSGHNPKAVERGGTGNGRGRERAMRAHA